MMLLLVIEKTKIVMTFIVTLTLGLQPRQRLVKVQAESEVRESHFMFMGV
jgi:hypothetical protein